MKNYLGISKKALQKHLEENSLDDSSINRIINEDFPYLFEWKLNPNTPEELAKGNSIVSFSFGFGPLKENSKNFNRNENFNPEIHYPGKSNIGLADKINGLLEKGFDVPVYAQWEVAEALKEKYGVKLPEKQIAKPKEGYLNTLGVLEQFLDNGLKDRDSLILVSQPYHSFRCKKTIEKAFDERDAPIEVLVADTSSVGFDKNSLQPWTRNLKSWVDYEVGSRFANRYKGLIDNQ